MDPGEVRELFEYMAQSRRRYLAKFRELGWEEYTKNREASFNSMHGIFVHILEVEDASLHYEIRGLPYTARDPSAFKSFDEVDAYDRGVAEKTRKLLEDATPQTLAGEAVFPWNGGKAQSSMENVLVHVFIDELAHLGELICLMWQMDVSPPHVSWIEDRLKLL